MTSVCINLHRMQHNATQHNTIYHAPLLHYFLSSTTSTPPPLPLLHHFHSSTTSTTPPLHYSKLPVSRRALRGAARAMTGATWTSWDWWPSKHLQYKRLRTSFSMRDVSFVTGWRNMCFSRSHFLSKALGYVFCSVGVCWGMRDRKYPAIS